ncbi:MAG: hypothetical protein JWQ88_1068 [Rhodoferax sp.]|nr:hypothetical protein [Rhodoferax sp.]
MKTANFFAATAAILIGLLAFGHDAQAAGDMGGTLGASMVLTASCAISGVSLGAGASDGNGNAVNFGMLGFGTQPSNFTGVLLANPTFGAQVGGATEISCSPDVSALSVSVSAGNNPGRGGSVGTGTRALRHGSSYLPYEVYSDAGMVAAFPAYSASTMPLGVVMPATGAPLALPVFGRINKTSAGAMPAGSYVDVLQVTLSW